MKLNSVKQIYRNEINISISNAEENYETEVQLYFQD